MESRIDELRELFETKIKKDILPFEKERKKWLWKIKWLVCPVSIIMIFLIVLFLLAGEEDYLKGVLLYGSMLLGLVYPKVPKHYNHNYKFHVIRRIVHFFDPTLTYRSSQGITKNEVEEGDLIGKPDIVKGEDLICGTIGKTHIRFSEVKAYMRGKEIDKETHKLKEYQYFFGQYFIADFNKAFKGRTYVMADYAEKYFGRYGKHIQKKLIKHGEYVKMEDPVFEKEFVVNSSDQFEARYILSTSLMRRIVEFRKKIKKGNVYLSFVNSKLHMIVMGNGDLFEPRMFRTQLSFDSIKEYYEMLQLFVGIVEELNLNLRIWTKR